MYKRSHDELKIHIYLFMLKKIINNSKINHIVLFKKKTILR